MFPTLGSWGGMTIYSYGTAAITAFVICMLIALRQRPKNLLRQTDLFNFCLILLFAGLLGGRLLPFLQDQPWQYGGVTHWLHFWQPGRYSFISGFAATACGAAIYCRFRGIPLRLAFDFGAPLGVLGMAIQRGLGCFLAGCCYGQQSNLPWAVSFPPGTHAHNHMGATPLHPTQLYYALTALLLYWFLDRMRRWKLPPGTVAATAMGGLTFSYLAISFLRGGRFGAALTGGMTTSQWAAFGIALVSLLCTIAWLRQPGITTKNHPITEG